MSKFYVGQRVKIVQSDLPGHWAVTHGRLVGVETKIVGGPYPGRSMAYSYWAVEASSEADIREDCLVPIIDPSTFERFMEKVLKPVELGEPQEVAK